ncbi:hypothetical protein CA51_33740 [Rosistilla oblonga]|nr:hypothetical protein CA51_33740 [Rosistilla oblonga]
MAPVTWDQPETADLGIGLSAFGAVAHVSSDFGASQTFGLLTQCGAGS